MTSDKPIRETSTHVYYQGQLGEFAVPKKTRKCLGCGKEFVFTVEESARHKKHGDVIRINESSIPKGTQSMERMK